MVNAHWKRNNLAKIRVNSEMLSEDANIKEGVVNTFHSLISKLVD